jgi:hypothetical protein
VSSKVNNLNSAEEGSAQVKTRSIRVFVSSTFRNMISERDKLMTHIWPILRKLCRERQVELVEVDLRWGIAEEQSTRKETLKLCLDEIRACRWLQHQAPPMTRGRYCRHTDILMS